jgi:Fe-S-cluster containining protein
VKAGFVPSCTRGCSACCRQFVSCTLPEATAILARYADVVDELRPRLREEVDAFLSVVASAGITEETVPGTTVRDVLAGLWWQEHRACAFLSEAGDCRIYEARPAACRTYLVKSDPALCAGESGTGVEIIGPDYEGCMKLLELAAGQPLHAGHLPNVVLLLRKEMEG